MKKIIFICLLILATQFVFGQLSNDNQKTNDIEKIGTSDLQKEMEIPHPVGTSDPAWKGSDFDVWKVQFSQNPDWNGSDFDVWKVQFSQDPDWKGSDFDVWKVQFSQDPDWKGSDFDVWKVQFARNPDFNGIDDDNDDVSSDFNIWKVQFSSDSQDGKYVDAKQSTAELENKLKNILLNTYGGTEKIKKESMLDKVKKLYIDIMSFPGND